ncbi:sodium- and chloride-dependent glycine transporter 2 isoform X1 [Rhipicephalus sanguineus]|uniref:sodium- and chloride-dependent glycine transporter 2 isoform X1 n=1 Tax=Rhipicephalus sanguineus TaxID=34632 RepID=UPI0018943469|nr:sodium- and chloride-dependent glycine transporter 2 isoform X1 [Rhipicephalus sanguineus]
MKQSSGSLTLTPVHLNGYDAAAPPHQPPTVTANKVQDDDDDPFAPPPPHRERSESVTSRGNWGSRWEFLLSCVGLSVGIGNVWRFPYLAYQNGGGAFLIPYLIMLALAGKPMYFLELAFGQFAGQGPLTIWACAPICKGVGYAMVCVSMVVAVYYNVIMAYTIYYTASTFQSQVPWARCDPQWANDTPCFVRSENTSGIDLNETKPSSQVYWERYVLEISDGLEDLGGVKWDLALCLLLSWIIVVACLVKGIKTSGKVVYFAATFPYVILITLMITGLCQPGAINGVLYFITPSWDRLLDIKVWQAAAGQMFFSLSLSMGGLIMYSSYNKFSNNVFRDAMVVSVLDTFTSIISGMVIFSVLGAMAHDLGNVDVKDVAQGGPGLAFVAYPEALTRLPVPQLWSVLFFLMLFILGLDSEFAILETFVTSLCDQIPFLRKHKWQFTMCMGVVCFLLGLPMVTRGGQYIFEIVDRFGGSTTLTFIGLVEVISLAYIYGYSRFSDDVYFMLNRRLGWYWKITWTVTSPLVLLVIFIFSMLDQNEPVKYGDYEYPPWAIGIGWTITLFVMLQIPFWAIVAVHRAPGNTLMQKMRFACRPSKHWGPSDTSRKDQWKAATGQAQPDVKVELKKFSQGDASYSVNGVENKAYVVTERDTR